MSESIDNKVIHMTFDNAKFERDIARTMDSIARLKSALDFSHVKTNLTGLSELSRMRMTVDTTQFNRNVADALKGIQQVQSNLNFSSSSRSLAHLSEGIRSFSLESMSSAIGAVGAKFSALSVIGVTALATIVSRAVSAGLNITKAFSVAPIIGGFQEMETNMNSIQTILANTQSKGSTLDDVNKALQQLNTYSDQTIYNFSQMARNIGTFTAAGVGLEESVGSIKGIANLAAISGSNAEQASSAMYQLSQALATGTLKLIDWNSVVNAGMGGEVFKNALFETGKALGTIADVPIDKSLKDWEKSGNNFRESLQEGWITSEVLTTTLQAFTGDLNQAQLVALGYTEAQAAEMEKLGKLGKASATEVKTLTQLLGTIKEAVGSGWSRTFQLIFGDFEEAKAMFTDFNNIIGGFVQRNADARNNIVAEWKKMGGRVALIQGIKNVFIALGDVIKPIREAFREFFPAITGERLAELTKGFQRFTGQLRLHGGQMWYIKEIFRGIFSAISIGIGIVREVIEVFSDLFTRFRDAHGGSILDFFIDLSGTIQDLKVQLIDEGGLSDFFDNLTEKLLDPIGSLNELKDNFVNFFQGIDFGSLDGLVEAFDRIKERIREVFDSLGFDFELPQGLTDFFQNFFDRIGDNTSNSIDMAGGFDRISTALGFLRDVLDGVWTALTNVDDVLGFLWDKFTSLKDIAFNVLEGMWEFAKDIGNALSTGLKSEELDSVLDILDSIALLMGGRGLQQLGENGLGLNAAIDLTGGNLPRVAGVMDQMAGTFGALRRNLDQLTSTLETMQTQIRANAILDIAKALALLTGSVLVLSFIDPAALGKSLTALAVGMGQLIGAVALLNTMNSLGVAGSVQLAAITGSMILIAGAMVVLAGAVRILSGLSVAELAKGLTGITVLLGAMVGVSHLLAGSSASLIAAGAGMIAIAVAMNIMGGAMKIFATLSWEDIGKGMVAVVGSLLAIAGAVHLIPMSIVLIGPGLIAVATALSILGGALLIMASMSWEEIGKGMVALGGGLLIIAGAMNLMPLTSVLNGPALIAVAVAMTILSGALKIFATMSWEEIGKAMAALGGSLLILAGGLTLMAGAIPGAVALGIASVSLGLFAAVLQGFAKIEWRDLGRGIAVMAIALAALAVAALAMQPVVPALLALSVALLALGAGFALIGVGAALLAEAFKVIADAGTAGVDVLMYAIDALLSRLPELVETFVNALIQLVQQMLEALPAIIEATGEIIQALLRVIIDAIPDAMEAITEFIQGILGVIRDTVPDFVATGIAILMAILRGIAENIDDVTATVAQIILNFLEELTNQVPALAAAGAALLIAFLDGIADNIGGVIEAGINVLEQFLIGIAENIDDVVGAVGDIITAFIDAVEDLYSDIADAGADAIIEFLEGMGDNARAIIDAAEDFIEDIIDAIVDNAVEFANDMADALIALLDGFTEAIETHDDEIGRAGRDLAWAIVNGIVTAIGLKAIRDALWNLGRSFAGKIVDGFKGFLGIDSPSKLFMELSAEIPAGITKGLDEDTSAEHSAANLARRTTEAFRRSIEQVAVVLQDADEFNPTITPILDLTAVKATAGEINGLLATTPIQPTASLEAAATLSAETTQAREDSATPPVVPVVKEVKFEQNIHSPQALTTATIYRQTRNQIELAKKELEVPV